MGYKCCVPGCKSNYESAGKGGQCSTFGFPKESNIKQQWLRNIPREFDNITKHTRVCILHFEEKDVHTHNIHTNSDGSTYRVRNELN